MKVIGEIKCTKASNRESVRFYLKKGLRAILGNDSITFNHKKLEIKIPTIDCTKVYSIKDRIFAFKPQDEGEIDELLGEYDVYQKDEDTFILKKKVMDNVDFVDMFDWEHENALQENKLLKGFVVSERLPAKIVVKIKFDDHDNEVNKRTFCRADQEKSES